VGVDADASGLMSASGLRASTPDVYARSGALRSLYRSQRAACPVVQIVTVFGGTGFLGRRIVRHLHEKGYFVRIASRHPPRGDVPQLRSIAADIHERTSVASAIAGAFGVVNAVSLYVARGKETFHTVHVAAAQRLANEAHKAGVESFVQISGIGADSESRSRYIRARGEGEEAVLAAFAGAGVIRPAVMFGPDDAFLNTVIKLLRRLPIYPMFGRGETQLQPVDVEDVAEAVARVIQRTETGPLTLECGGPRMYSNEELLRTIARAASVKPFLLPVPFVVWHALALVAQVLPGAPVTRNQVELMQVDTVASPSLPGFVELGISPRPMEVVLEGMLRP
jgi:uncharacterized protein YbjT (DUF2867 family)